MGQGRLRRAPCHMGRALSKAKRMTAPLDRRTMLGALACSALLPSPLAASPIPPPDREAMVPVEGGRIYVRINGRLDGPRPPLLMIHGGPGGTHATFLEALPLAGERAIILYDQLDSGRSDGPNDPANWRVPRFVGEVDAIRRFFGIERLHVLGASWGGTIALEYAARRPAGLLGTVLQSPLVSTRSWLADAAALRAALPPTTRTTLSACETASPPAAADCEAATAIFYRWYNRREDASPEVLAYRRALPNGFNPRLYNAMWGSSEFVSTGSLKDYDGEPLLTRLDGPRTLFVVGQYDEARPATVADFAARTPGADFAVTEHAAHGIFNDNPEAANQTVARWLRRHDSA